MPSEDLLQHFQRGLKPAARWRVGGQHDQRIAAGWLANLDRNSDRARPLLAATYGTYRGVFFMACAELRGYRGGGEWQGSRDLLRTTSLPV
jgi:cyclopropane-fatty-acyl-phospholipid synthase